LSVYNNIDHDDDDDEDDVDANDDNVNDAKLYCYTIQRNT